MVKVQKVPSMARFTFRGCYHYHTLRFSWYEFKKQGLGLPKGKKTFNIKTLKSPRLQRLTLHWAGSLYLGNCRQRYQIRANGYGRDIERGPFITQLSNRCDSLGLPKVCGDSWGLLGTHVDSWWVLGRTWGCSRVKGNLGEVYFIWYTFHSLQSQFAEKICQKAAETAWCNILLKKPAKTA